MSDWSSDVCSSDLPVIGAAREENQPGDRGRQYLRPTHSHPSSRPLASSELNPRADPDNIDVLEALGCILALDAVVGGDDLGRSGIGSATCRERVRQDV